MANAGQIILPYGDAPSTPSSSKNTLYFKDDKAPYYKTDDGNEYPLDATISGTIEHGELLGLDDDDHTQYLLADGTRELSGNLSVASGVTIDGVLVAQAYNGLIVASKTGVLAGGVLSVNSGDNTKFDISDGAGFVIDNHTNAFSPSLTYVTWSGVVGESTPYLATHIQSYVMIDENATVLVQTAAPSPDDRRDYIILGKVIHFNNTNIMYTNSTVETAYDMMPQVLDFLYNMGSMNMNGNVYSTTNSGLSISKTEGQTFSIGSNYYDSRKLPSIKDNIAGDPLTFNYHVTTSTPGVWSTVGGNTQIQPNKYDDLVGDLVTISGSKWTIQTMFLFAGTSSTNLQYGQVVYDTLEDALSARGDAFSLNPVLEEAVFRGWLIVNSEATDLTNDSQAVYISAGKFGLATEVGAGASEITTATNVGFGQGVYKQKDSSELQFRSLTATSPKIVFTNNDNDIGIDVGESNIDHGNIGGLSDDDHTQYLLSNGNRQLSGDWDFGSNSISGTGSVYTGDLNIDGSIDNVEWIDFDTDLIGNPSEKNGRLFWDKSNRTLSLYNTEFDTTLQIGQESYVKVYNDKSYTITNGSVVFVDGSYLNTPTVSLSIASDLNIQDIGIATHNIAVSGTGFITTFGMINDVNTTTFLPGDILYTSATVSGGLVNTPPITPNRVSQLGWVVTACTEGKILIGVKKNVSMSILSDVHIEDVEDADTLVYSTVDSTWHPVPVNDHNHTSGQINHDNNNWVNSEGGYYTVLDDILDKSTDSLLYLGGNGALTDTDYLNRTDYYEVTISSGSGYLIKNSKHYDIEWDTDIISTYGFADGFHYVYVDETGTVNVTQAEPSNLDSIKLGGFYCAGAALGFVPTWYNAGFSVDGATNRLANAFFNLGPFITNDGGSLTIWPTDKLKVTGISCTVQNTLKETLFQDVSSSDGMTNFFAYFKINELWYSDPYMFMVEEGRITTSRYNDTNADISQTPDLLNFTQYSPYITASGNLTSTISGGNIIYADNGTPVPDYLYSAVVSGVEWTGSQTIVTLMTQYLGDSVTTSGYINRGIPPLPDDKWIKHLVMRSMDGAMFMVYSQNYYDTEDEALAAGLPDIPIAISERGIKLASIVCQKGETDLTGHIHDLRPLPFTKQVSSGGQGGGGTATDHGSLTGLGNDDHAQYHTNTRGDIRYYTKTELNAGQLNNLYYTETELNAGQLNNLYYTESEVDSMHTSIVSQIITDHTGLSNIGSNTHSQIDSHISNSNIHFSKGDIDIIDLGDTPASYDNGKYLKSTSDGTEWATIEDASVFGSEFHQNISDGESSTSSTSLVTKVSLTTSSLPLGMYRIGWFAEMHSSATNWSAIVQVLLNTTELSYYREASDGSLYWSISSGFYNAAALSGVNTIYIKYATSSSSYTAYIRRARLEMWRIS